MKKILFVGQYQADDVAEERVTQSDALFLLDGWYLALGAWEAREHAYRNNVPVFYGDWSDIKEVQAWVNESDEDPRDPPTPAPPELLNEADTVITVGPVS